MSVDPTTALPSRPSPGAAGARLGQLYADHSRMVYGVCRMLLRDPNEAEDATQQVFLSAYRNLLTGTEVRDPAAWLGTIARNTCRRRAVSRMREPLAVGDDEITLVSPGVEETAIGREEAAALYAELGDLPEKQREAVVLRDLYGLRYDEVAKALGTSRPAVEALLFRGRRRLQRRLRPGLAAGVLIVPLAVQESIAYAVPGFASTAAPAGAAAAAAGIPLLVKLAAGGAAVSIAGSAAVAERSLHDPPARPAEVRLQAESVQAAVVPTLPAASLSAPTAGAPRAVGQSGGAGVAGDDDRNDDGQRGGAAGSAGGDEKRDEEERDEEERDEEERDEDERGEDRADDGDRSDRAEEREEQGNSGSGSGKDEAETETGEERADEDEPADFEEPDEPDGSGSDEDDGSVGEES